MQGLPPANSSTRLGPAGRHRMAVAVQALSISAFPSPQARVRSILHSIWIYIVTITALSTQLTFCHFWAQIPLRSVSIVTFVPTHTDPFATTPIPSQSHQSLRNNLRAEAGQSLKWLLTLISSNECARASPAIQNCQTQLHQEPTTVHPSPPADAVPSS